MTETQPLKTHQLKLTFMREQDVKTTGPGEGISLEAGHNALYY